MQIDGNYTKSAGNRGILQNTGAMNKINIDAYVTSQRGSIDGSPGPGTVMEGG